MKKTIYYYETEKIKEMLLYRKIVEVKYDYILVLDDGTELEVYPNEGCGGCSSGWYDIVELNECENVITNVECVCDELDGGYDGDKSYKIFVYSENEKTKILQVDGGDGNGYYGTGYWLKVEVKNDQ